MESVHDDVAASVGDVVVFGFGSDGRGRRGGRCFCQTKNNEHPHPHAVGARARGFAARGASPCPCREGEPGRAGPPLPRPPDRIMHWAVRRASLRGCSLLACSNPGQNLIFNMIYLAPQQGK